MDLVPNSAIPELQIINSDMAPARVAAVRANVTNTIPGQLWQGAARAAQENKWLLRHEDFEQEQSTAAGRRAHEDRAQRAASSGGRRQAPL
eukprot:COSAG01_NODE_29433_length_637_cov_5.014870_1_plen_90_part_10